MAYQVIATPTDDKGCYQGTIIGQADTTQEAVALCEANGYTVIRQDDGGSYEQHNAADAPWIFGFDADDLCGLGAISVTVEIKR